MRKRFGADNPRSWLLRFHTQTSGATLTAQQPNNNVVRVAFQALASVLGGTQSLHTNSFDEAYALPSEEAVRIALRTQQIIAYESGVADTVDPMAGSYYIEHLTNRIEEEAMKHIDKIDSIGGAVAAIEKGYIQREIVESAYRYQKEIESKKKVVVGVNEFRTEEKTPIPILRVNRAVEKRQIDRLNTMKRKRNNVKVGDALEELRHAAEGGENLMLVILEAVKEYASMGEICGVLREVFGEYKAPTIF